MQQKCHQGTFYSPLSKTQFKEGIRLFVDHASLTLHKTHNAQLSVNQMLQRNAQKWEKLLNATGGKLEISKCKYATLEWKFDQDGLPTTHDSIKEDIKIRNISTGKVEGVPAITAKTAYELLGAQIALDGNQTTQIQTLQQKCKTHASMFAQCNFRANDIKMGYDQAFMPATKCPLAATTLSEQQCEDMQGPVKDIVVSKMGHNQKMPKAIIFASEMNGGLELGNVYVGQGIKHVMFVTQHIRAKSETAKIILCLLETYQLRAGIDHDAVTNTEHVAHVEAPWINTLREFLHVNNAKIVIPELTKLNKKGIDDQPIMQLLKHIKFSKKRNKN